MRKIILLVALLLTLGLEAQTLKKTTATQAKAMVEKISRAAAATKTLESGFVQVKSISFLNDKLTSYGRMYYDGSGKLRWEYTKPYTYAFVLNGQQVNIVSKQGSQRIDIAQNKLFKGIAQVMMNSVTGKSLTSGKDFVCEMYTEGDNWVADLTPQRKELKQLFKTIRIYFDSKRQTVGKVEMTERKGDKTVITLKDVKTNVTIDEKVFAIH